MKFLPNYIKATLKEKYTLGFLAVFLLIGLFILFLDYSNSSRNKESNSSQEHESDSPDTVIPNGFVLVPIELINGEALSGMIDQFAIVDLYTNPNPGEKTGQKIGNKLRLIRAPLNPRMFAVLVPEAEAHRIVSTSGPVVGVLQNRNQIGLGTIEKKSPHKSNIHYYN